MILYLLDIPTIFGLSIEVYLILIILGIPTFFFWRWIFKKYIKVNKTRKILIWLATIILTPCIYELSNDIIESKMLIGKSKSQVRQILGDEDNNDSLNVWTFGLGVRPELFNIDDS